MVQRRALYESPVIGVVVMRGSRLGKTVSSSGGFYVDKTTLPDVSQMSSTMNVNGREGGIESES